MGWLSTVRNRAAIQHVRHFNWPHQLHPPTPVGIRNPYGILQHLHLRQNFTVNIILPGVKIATARRSGIVGKKNEMWCAWVKGKYWFSPSVVQLFLRLKDSLGFGRNEILAGRMRRKRSNEIELLILRFLCCQSCTYTWYKYDCWGNYVNLNT